jgi:hypothetical protein
MKAAMAQGLGIQVNLCGKLDDTIDAHQPVEFRRVCGDLHEHLIAKHRTP